MSSIAKAYITVVLAAFSLAGSILPSTNLTLSGPLDAWYSVLGTPHAVLVQPQPGSIQRDITYCTGGGQSLKMDLYYPQALTPGTLSPAVLYVHGGAWRTGSKSEATLFTDSLTGAGYVVASINYRLVPQHKWPAQIEDTKCAVRHLHAKATEYGLDPARIGIMGGSAGAHLAAVAALAGKDAGLEGTGGYPEESSEVVAVVDLFGPTDLAAPLDARFPVWLMEDLIGKPLAQAIAELRQASPVTYVTGSAPPFLIMHGDKDRVVPLSQSQTLHERLTQAGAKSTLVVVKNADHSFVPLGGPIEPNNAQIGQIIVDFLNANVRDAPPSTYTFPETGKTVSGIFLRYWLRNGAVAQQGYPISEEMQEQSNTDGKQYTVQYFERAVFELHPENDSTPSEVLLSLLGAFRYSEKYPQGAPSQTPNQTPGSVLFPETGKRLGGKFLDYWRENGGLAQQGFPISDELTEVSDLDGKQYTVQYFERAVFEYHPENPAPYDVLLSQLGTFRHAQKHGTRIGEQP